MQSDDLQGLVRRLCGFSHETEWLEFKKDNTNPHEIGEYISAIANSACILGQPRGFLVFGVENVTHRIVGTKFHPKHERRGNEELENWLLRLLSPRIDFRVIELELDGKNIVLFDIGPARAQPVKFDGNAYIRVGSYKKKLSDFPEKERQIWQKSAQNDFESGIAKEGVDGGDVSDLLKWDDYFRMLKLPVPKDLDGIIDAFIQESILEERGGKFDVTNLGAILFARSLASFEGLRRKAVRVILYEGRSRLKAQKEQEGVFGYASGFEGLIDYILDRLPSNEEIGKALRSETPVYPPIAIRELVANALIHQDFAERGNGPMVEIFKDRVEISNPGKPLIDLLRLIDHSPKSRNEELASFMRRLNVCEERGSGIDKVVTAVELYQLPPPSFEQESTGFKAVMSAYRPLAQMTKAERVRACYQHCTLKYISGEFMSNQSLRDRLDVKKGDYSIVSRIIADAVKRNLVKERDPSNKSKKFARYIPFWA